MQIETFQNWYQYVASTLGTADSVTTKIAPTGCTWKGIAIGPESEEGYVRINGIVWQSGRWFPLRAAQYKIERIVPRGDSGTQSIKRLQVMLAEHESELATDARRPAAEYEVAGLGTAGVLTSVLRVPTSGRRQTLFVISSGALTAYRVFGINSGKFAPAGGHSYQLKDEPAPPAGVNAFYIGGDDNAELWAELNLHITVTGATAYQVYAQTTGESGL